MVIEALRGWILNICVAVFFITAVEMILPNNSMKKYGKFVMGLILIVVMLKPIIQMYDKNFNFAKYSSEASKYLEGEKYNVNVEEHKEKNIKNTMNRFERNLEVECEKELNEKYPNQNHKAYVKANYDKEKGVFNIENIEVEVEVGEEGVKKVKKIEINSKSVQADKKKTLNDINGDRIKKYLSNKFEIPEEVINIYKLNS